MHVGATKEEIYEGRVRDIEKKALAGKFETQRERVVFERSQLSPSNLLGWEEEIHERRVRDIEKKALAGKCSLPALPCIKECMYV